MKTEVAFSLEAFSREIDRLASVSNSLLQLHEVFVSNNVAMRKIVELQTKNLEKYKQISPFLEKANAHFLRSQISGLKTAEYLPVLFKDRN